MAKPQRVPKKQKQKITLHDLKSLPVLHLHAAGIDVGSAEHYVAVPAHRDPQSVRRFGSFTADLHRLAQWLKACRMWAPYLAPLRGYAWNSEASGKRSLHLARVRVRSSSTLASSQLRAMASSLTRR